MGYFDLDSAEMVEVYLLEAKQLIGQLNEAILAAEKKGAFEESDIHCVFRVMHTLKSSSAMMGLQDLSVMSHKMEDLFSYYREELGRIDRPEQELLDLLYAVSDFIEDELKQMEEEDYQPKKTEKLQHCIEDYLKKVSAEENKEAQITSQSEEPEKKIDFFEGKSGVVVRITLETGCRMENIRVFMLVRQISNLCSMVETYPENLEKDQSTAEYIEKNGAWIRFESENKEEVLESLQKGLFVNSCQIIADRSEMESESAAEAKGPVDADNKKDTEYLNVRMDRLDQLQNLTGELLIQMLSLDNELGQRGLDELREGTAHQISRLVSELERTVMETRLVPVDRLVPKLRRIMRDICRNQEKEVELVIQCGDIEADKSVVDYVSEALLHIMRNAVDHGIEDPKERMEAGKNRKGIVTFRAESAAGELKIAISDDGRGIDVEKILAKARQKELLIKQEDEYNFEEVCQLILLPGFTTNREVTEYSGRGVGLDVVKEILENVGGHIHIQSEVGKGSTFLITVPLNLATMESVRFGIGDYRFSLPARNVYRFLEYARNKKWIEQTAGRDWIMYDNRMVPLVDLRKFYGIEGETPEKAILIYLNSGKTEGCILVDRMYEQKRIVIKRLPSLFGLYFRGNTGVCGFSIMGSGKICTALDTEILLELYGKEGRCENGKE